VLLSIKPKYCELIASGRKTIEIRKTKPKLLPPFKCYIYMTNTKGQPLHLLDTHTTQWKTLHFGKGKVIGEFVCDAILSHCEMANADMAEQQGCVKREDLLIYASGKELFGWHISNLVIYDAPQKISEFWEADKCPHNYNGACMHRGHCARAGMLKRCGGRITKAPQSWRYVER